MSEKVRSVTRKTSSDFHGGIRFQSSFTIRWELEDKNFLKIDIICLDDSLKHRIIAIKKKWKLHTFIQQWDFQKALRDRLGSLRTADISPRSSPLRDVSRGGMSDDVNQCLHNKSRSHGVSNANLFNFAFLLVDFGKVLCSSSNELLLLKCFF